MIGAVVGHEDEIRRHCSDNVKKGFYLHCFVQVNFNEYDDVIDLCICSNSVIRQVKSPKNKNIRNCDGTQRNWHAMITSYTYLGHLCVTTRNLLSMKTPRSWWFRKQLMLIKCLSDWVQNGSVTNSDIHTNFLCSEKHTVNVSDKEFSYWLYARAAVICLNGILVVDMRSGRALLYVVMVKNQL